MNLYRGALMRIGALLVFFFSLLLGAALVLRKTDQGREVTFGDGRRLADSRAARPKNRQRILTNIGSAVSDSSQFAQSAPPEVSPPILAWEQHLAEITNASGWSETAKANELFTLLTSLPEEALEIASREAVGRLPDKEYAVAFATLTNPQTHGAVLGVLFADLLERPDEITLPTLLAIARNRTHPFASAAQENLELLLGQNFGRDWLKWDAEIRRALK